MISSSPSFLFNTIQPFLAEGAQGYTTADVNKQLIPSQLIPVIFQAIINLGIALILWGAGLINQKLATLLKKENLSE
jgi:hypothetical protein